MATARKTPAIVKTSTNLATIKPANVAVAEPVPEYLRHLGGQQGFEQADKEDFILPRLSICQALTPQRQKSKPNYIEGLKEGDFFNSVTGKIYGPKVKVVPLFLTKQRIKFKGKIGEGIDCQSPNGKTLGQLHPQGCRTCPHAQWGTGKDGSGQACTEFKNIVVMVEGEDQPLVFSNKSTGIRVVKQWLSMMKLSNMDMFAAIYQIETDTTVIDTNEFYTWNYARVGFVPEASYLRAKAFFDSFSDKDIAFNPEEFEDGDTLAGADSGAF